MKNNKNKKFNQNQCIYCKQIKFNSEFNREHVISESFGTFGPNTMVLNNCVCRDCNTYSANNLELYLGRDSIFGIAYRPVAGAMNSKEFMKTIKFKRKRIEPSIMHQELGKLIVNLQLNRQNKFELSLANQLLIANSTNGFRLPFRIELLPHRSVLDSLGLKVHRNHIVALANPDFLKSQQEAPYSALARSEFNIKFNTDRTQPILLPNTMEEIHFNSLIDGTIMRAIAKIAFNYFAKIMGADFVLSESFDEIRNFIRYNLLSEQHLTSWDQKPIVPKLYTPTDEIYARHMLFFKKDFFSRNIVAQVSLFNNIFFKVVLSRNYPIAVELRQGTVFDVANNQIEDISKQI